jgi:hypothetical protein
MAQDYMPKSLRNLKDWLTNLKTRITADGPTLGQTPAQVTSDTDLIDGVLTLASDALTKQSAWVQADGTARDAVTDNDGKIRDLINRYKAATGWTEGMAEAWEVRTSQTTYDMGTHKPTITVQARAAMNEVRGKKPGFTAVDIQMRLEGASAWTTIGTKINHFPFFDTTAPQTPGKPEKREYRALGYKGDTQAGQPSDIVTAVFTG